MKKAFSLAEVLIVVAILGILAALVMPTLKGHIAEAKEAAAKDNLRILRNAIELYAAKNNGVPPGYPNNDPTRTPLHAQLRIHLIKNHYLPKMPCNPFSEQTGVKVLANNENFPTEPVQAETNGWLYQPATKTIKLNSPGTDSKGIPYLDY